MKYIKKYGIWFLGLLFLVNFSSNLFTVNATVGISELDGWIASSEYPPQSFTEVSEGTHDSCIKLVDQNAWGLIQTNIPSQFDLNDGKIYWFSYWLKTTETGDNAGSLSLSPQVENLGAISLRVENGRDLYCYYGPSGYNADTGYNVAANEWVHLAISYQKNGLVEGYLNGNKICSKTAGNLDLDVFRAAVRFQEIYFEFDYLGESETDAFDSLDYYATATTTSSDTTSSDTTTDPATPFDNGSSTLWVLGVILGVAIVVVVGVSRSKGSAPRTPPRTSYSSTVTRQHDSPYLKPRNIVAVPVPIPVPVFLEDTEKILLEKFKSILEISQEVEIARIARSLKLSEDVLFEKMLQWNKAIPFKIRGKMVVVENMGNFMAALDNQFSEWDIKEDRQEGKI